MKKLLISFSLLLIFTMPVVAQETLPSPSSEIEAEVEVGDVPMPGGFADWWLQNITERIESLTARGTEKKLELEEKFAARREAQLTKLETLDDNDPRKAKLITKVEERYQKHLTRLEKTAENLLERKEEILERLTERKERFEEKKELVETRKEDREAKREEIKARMEEKKVLREEKREEIKDSIEERREEFKKNLEEKKTQLEDKKSVLKNTVESGKLEIKERQVEFKERMKLESAERKKIMTEKAKPAEVKFAERVKEEVKEAEKSDSQDDEDDEKAGDSASNDNVLGLTTSEYNRVLGASDYQPVGLLEKIGWWLAGR